MADVMSYVRCSCCKKITAAVEEVVLDMGKMLVYHGSYTEILLEFPSMTEEWLDFIIACREDKPHDYDIVIGAMANDQIYNYVADCMYAVPTHWDIGKVYKRLILMVAADAQIDVIDALVKVYQSKVSDLIENYNSSFYYDNINGFDRCKQVIDVSGAEITGGLD